MEQKQLVEVLKALGDETRLNIVNKLTQADDCVSSCDIVESCASFLNLSQPTMSHHFSKLVDAGVLIEEKHGTSKKYRVDSDYLQSIGVDVSKIAN